MRGERTERSRPDRLRWVRASGAAGAMAVVSIMALSAVATAGIAHPATFPAGTYWVPYTSRTNGGCAQAHAFPAHWTSLTGAGKWHGSTSAKTCPAYRGGLAAISEGLVTSELDVVAPIAHATGTGGVNVTWNLNYALAVSGALSGTNYNCPGAWSNSTYNAGYTWINSSFFFANCEAGANAQIGAYAYMIDTTNGTFMPASNFWLGVFNDSGSENLSELYSVNYSNSSYWGSNYSFSYAVNGTFGGPTSYSATASPEFFINGTFNSAHKYVLTTYVYESMVALAFGFNSPGNGASSLNLASLGHHENLAAFQIW